MNKVLYGLTPANMLRTLPDVLARDEGMNALAQIVANAIAGLVEETRAVQIYTRIDELDEKVLDILAVDLRADWYDYNYSLATKRAMIRDSFFSHRHLGTKGSITQALRDIYPNSTLMEWFEYGGDPFFYRVIIDVTNTIEPADLGLIKKKINYHKSLRSHMDEDNVIVRIGCGIAVKTSVGGIPYSTPKAGTIPAVSTRGGIADIDLMAETAAQGALYQTPKTGMQKSGTAPLPSTQGGVDDSVLVAEVSAPGSLYRVPKCGTAPNALM